MTSGPDSASPRPLFLRGRYIGLVFIGGAIGTAARESLNLIFPAHPNALPWTTLAINLLGALLLGALLAGLTARGSDESRRHGFRMLLGTGLLGGFTTYSALAAEAVALSLRDSTLAVVYGLGSVALGVGAAFLGMFAVEVIGNRIGRRSRT